MRFICKTLGYSLLSVFVIGCGQSKTTKLSSTSRGLDPSVNYGTNYLIGECNRVQLSQMNIAGQIGTYYDPATMSIRSDYLNLNLTSVPAEIYTSSTLQFQFYRWLERTAGQKEVNTIPTRFQFFDKLTGTKTPSNGVDRLSKTTIDAARAAFGSSWLNVSTTQFFERTMILLTGVDMQYTGISMAKYDTSISTNVLSQGDILIPPFYSNPNVYKNINPLPDLYNLHPNIGLLGSNSTENDYHQLIESICYELSGMGTRIPASANAPTSLFAQVWGRILDSLETVFTAYLR